ncbi:Pyrophosphatase PpaX [Posidoniimonas polymericola]|uniref:phosphoglycolate phosphatase n=1 Tax=Posidoniimonas polymericola TaxID=2528002 RepID=A0A5C5YKW3_9BACT|nr:HAD family hydrolase [Posidoniimonas polymericola]TWT75491.1 Pyrophosphatase PpaX [Posidoniimonas polymericola]
MKTCLFDIDGTLIQTGGAGQVAFAQTFDEVFGVDEITNSVSFAGRSDRAIALDLMRSHDIDVNEETWQSFRQGYAARLPAALAACVGQVLPGVPSLIDALQQRGDVLIGLLTGNLEQTAELKLAHYGLWDHFDFGGFGDVCTNRDDIAAAAVREAVERAPAHCTPPYTIVVIGDTQHDVTCAHSVGAKAVAVPTGGATADQLRQASPDLFVESLEDVAPILRCFD